MADQEQPQESPPTGAEGGERAAFQWRPVWSTVLACLAAAGLTVCAGLAVAAAQGRLAIASGHLVAAASGAVTLGLLAFWLEARFAGNLPPRRRDQPRRDPHLSGAGLIGLAIIASLIIALALWAARDADTEREIRSEWGVGVVFGLAIAFFAAAIAPSLDLERRAGFLGRFAGVLLRPFGVVVSFLDSFLVYAVAPAAGASQSNVVLRYLLLLMTLAPCAVLGFVLVPPWGLAPLAWGFVVVIAISRRWAWVEDDRELAMLNGSFTGAHLRIGFGQDLRDEALIGFMAMFFLVPLALRQAHLWTDGAGLALFDVAGQGDDFLVWLGFFGAELAKAVPFVDWAEIYDVSGRTAVTADHPDGLHLIFATRVLVDLVFLAALLQAIAISSRNAKQRQLFFKDRILERLDPFIEKTEFRRLQVDRSPGQPPQVTHPQFGDFPVYDTARLLALRDEASDPHIAEVAKALLQRDGEDNTDALHETLTERAITKRPDAAQLDEVIAAIRLNGRARKVYELDQARQAIVRFAALRQQRYELAKLIAEAGEEDLATRLERSRALMDVLEGPARDAWADVRLVAVEGLRAAAARGEQEVLSTLLRVADADAAQKVRRRAKELATGLPG